MSSQQPKKFLCIGNGSYHNRGCEAIVRGTMRILREYFGEKIVADCGAYGDDNDMVQQMLNEPDPAVRHFHMKETPPRWSRPWLENQFNKRFGARFPGLNYTLNDKLRGVEAALILGGDTYSLDYGFPWRYVRNDQFVLRHNIPVVLWAASVGPFHEEPQNASVIFDHLRQLTGVFVREEETLGYLEQNGVSDNVRLVADPAFVMDAEEPSRETLGFDVPKGAIGLNFSPLIAKYYQNLQKQSWMMEQSDLDPWIELCAEIVVDLINKTGRPIILVPHVLHRLISVDDHFLLKQIQERVQSNNGGRVLVGPRNLNSMETKWLIGQCAVFGGCRTHSTIAALSSCVPTLTVSFSIKAIGINQDIFGHLDHIIDSKVIAKEDFVERIMHLLENEQPIRTQLEQRIPAIQERAMEAGPMLAEILDTLPVVQAAT